jgi:hypothetical protein
MLKFLIVGAASFALIGSAAAADLPRAQPVYKEAQVGKMPIGKTPIGKTPIGKTPIGKAPLVTRGWGCYNAVPRFHEMETPDRLCMSGSWLSTASTRPSCHWLEPLFAWSIQASLAGMLLGFLGEDVHRSDDEAWAFFDRLNVYERDDARTVGSLDNDCLIAQSLAGREHIAVPVANSIWLAVNRESSDAVSGWEILSGSLFAWSQICFGRGQRSRLKFWRCGLCVPKT